MPEYVIVFIIKNAITNCYKITREKKRERNSERRIDRDQMTDRKRRQNLAKCCSVSAVAELNESMKLLRSERTSTRFGKNLPIMGSEMWYVFDFS